MKIELKVLLWGHSVGWPEGPEEARLEKSDYVVKKIPTRILKIKLK